MAANRDDLLQLANVVAVGFGRKNGTGRFCVTVSVTKKLPSDALAPSDLVPDEVDGWPTDVVETGIIRAFGWPARGGDSIGHVDITAGTLGCAVWSRGQRLILSNNHVLANSNAAQLGDPILQPGPYDGGQLPDDAIGWLHAFEPINFIGDVISECPLAKATAWPLNLLSRMLFRKTRLVPVVEPEALDNLVDAAVAMPARNEDLSSDIRDIGVPVGTAAVAIGTVVRKSGRTTGFTADKVLQTGVTVQVQYGEGKIAVFRDQFVAGPMSAPGDSGSAVVDAYGQLVGLLFAGSDQVTICNNIGNVFDALDLEL